MAKRNDYCSFCGVKFEENQPFPRTCGACGNITYVNPLPVSVVVLPIDETGVLVIRRGIEPRKGKLALPGGFIGVGESWQAAGARELYEETGITIDPQSISDFRVLSAPDGTVLIFGLAQTISSDELPTFIPTDETSEMLILTQVEELAFPLHTQVLRQFFERKR
ncbi:MAG: NUDIX domain-containing protein [Blastocatellia bacterium]|nr:NUDIX domain-containing protein [Blastocatellia bacterium]